MFLVELQVGSILNRDDTLAIRDLGRKNVQEGRLAGARSPGDQNVQARFDASLQELQHRRSEGVVGDQIISGQGIPPETPNGEPRPIYSEGRNDGVDARTVRKPRIYHWRRLVDASADSGDDSVN